MSHRENGVKVNGTGGNGLSGGIPSIRIGDRRLSAYDPALIVAEIGLNHCGQMDRALKLIEAAADSGADAVKFQKRSPRDLLTTEAYNQSYYNGGNSFGLTYGKHREALEFDKAAFRDLQAAAKELNMLCFTSVWDVESLDSMAHLDMPVVKIPSADLTNQILIRAAAESGTPIFISTGMSKTEEVDYAIELLQSLDAQFVLFHCVSLYPTPSDQARLETLKFYSAKYQVPIGYSGHEMETAVALAARSLGACVIEKHFTLDRSWKGGDQKISLTPEEFADMVENVRVVERALHGGIRTGILEGEIRQRRKLGKSIVATRTISAGEKIEPEMLACKCPGGGLSPQNIHRLIGRTVKWDIGLDEYVLESHLEGSVIEPVGESLGEPEEVRK